MSCRQRTTDSSRAVVVEKFGSYDSLKVKDFQLPPLENHVEVKVKYGGLNFADLYTRQGLMDKDLPFVLGMECVGTITKIDVEEVTDFKVGQRVICYDIQCGMYRDVVRTTPDKIYRIPDHATFEEAAAIFVNYLTAYFSVMELGNLKKNETVLILSCGGGVGVAATQLAKNFEGVTVVGTTSSWKHAEVKKIGVDIPLVLDDDFQTEIVKRCPGGFDLIITNYAGSLYGFLETLLKPLGRIVLIGANNMIQNDSKLTMFTRWMNWWSTKNVYLEDQIVYNRVSAGLHLGTLIATVPDRVRDTLAKIFELLRQKRIKVRIHSVLPMEKIVEATKMLAERKNVGKVLISMR